MVVVRIIGGLGNQMFQYAYALALKKKGYDVKLDLTSIENYTLHGGYQLNHYKINLPVASSEELINFIDIKKKDKFFALFNKNIFKQVKEHGLNFKERLLKVSDNSYIKGYFQSQKYFLDISKDIKETFSLKNFSEYTKKTKELINNDDNSVSLHIRRGDYVSNEIANKVHGTCDLEYYYRAVDFLSKKIDYKNIFIFSDDIKWCKENLNLEKYNCIYVDSINNKLLPHEDIFLMSLCKHNIIANSSFSWWGAWLNTNPDKIVVVPKRWYLKKEKQKQVEKSLIPESWFRI